MVYTSECKSPKSLIDVLTMRSRSVTIRMKLRGGSCLFSLMKECRMECTCCNGNHSFEWPLSLCDTGSAATANKTIKKLHSIFQSARSVSTQQRLTHLACGTRHSQRTVTIPPQPLEWAQEEAQSRMVACQRQFNTRLAAIMHFPA